MARKAITDLTSATFVSNTDLFAIVTGVGSSPETKSITANLVFQYVAGRSSGISNGSSNVYITRSNGNVSITSVSYRWDFSNNSVLTLPNGAKLYAGFPGTDYDPTIVTLTANQAYLASPTGSSYLGIDGQNGLASILVEGATGSPAYWEFLRSKTTVVPGTIRAPQLTKANNATGAAGEISWDANYIYVCIATNTWKRATLNDY
jgi:hypothetical protein